MLRLIILILLPGFSFAQIPLTLDMNVTIIESDTVIKSYQRVELIQYKKHIYFRFGGTLEAFKVIDATIKLPGAYETFIVKNIKTGIEYTYCSYINNGIMFTFTNTKGRFPLWVFKFNGHGAERGDNF